MFGTLIAAKAFRAALVADATIQSDLGARVVNNRRIPADVTLPALLFYPEDAPYSGVVGSAPGDQLTAQTCRYVVRVATAGESFAPIYNAALAQLAVLNGLDVTVTDHGADYQVLVNPAAEYPLTHVAEGDREYRQLGTIYTVEIYRLT
jgi:hypothetical protein